jgi:5S rRNA maturation endonuclease (ribonuclease M5)
MKSIKNQYIDLQEGKMSQAQFLRNVRLNIPQYVTNVTSFGDTIKILKNKGILSEADIKYKDGKDMYAQFKEIDNLNGQEYKTGIAVEHGCNPDKTEEEIIKIVVKNLKKNPFYYTDYKMSGVAGYEPEYIGGKSAEPNARQMKPVEKDNAVDKAMGMKPVKGFEKAKASSNKAKKETNKGENVELMSLIAKTVRGLVKMDATGEKVKKIIVKEVTDAQQKYIDKSAHLPSKKLSHQMNPFEKEVAAAKKMISRFKPTGFTGADEEKLRNKFSSAAINAANAELIDDDYMNESLNEGPLGTQLLRKADAALKAGQTVTVLGKPIMKIVIPVGALFPADGGPSFRLNNLESPLEDILIDGNEIELDLPAPRAPYVDTRTPDQIAADQAAFNDRYGPGGGYDTPMGRRTFDEAMGDTLSQAQQYIDSNPTLKSADIKLQKSGDDVILSYNSYSPLTPEVAAALEMQFDFEEDQVDGGGEDKDKIYYTLSPKYTTPNVGVGLQSMEEMIRKVVREMFDGRDNVTDVTGETL